MVFSVTAKGRLVWPANQNILLPEQAGFVIIPEPQNIVRLNSAAIKVEISFSFTCPEVLWTSTGSPFPIRFSFSDTFEAFTNQGQPDSSNARISEPQPDDYLFLCTSRNNTPAAEDCWLYHMRGCVGISITQTDWLRYVVLLSCHVPPQSSRYQVRGCGYHVSSAYPPVSAREWSSHCMAIWLVS